jgi:hypothetical protein
MTTKTRYHFSVFIPSPAREMWNNNLMGDSLRESTNLRKVYYNCSVRLYIWQIPPLLHQGTHVYQSAHKAEVLAQIFERAHHLTLHAGSPRQTTIISRSVTRFFQNNAPQTPPTQLTNIYEVKRKILLLKTRSAPGLDDITPTMLRHLSNKALTHLTTVFNHLLLQGHFPEPWKRCKVIPIPKPNKPITDPTSYRPISLLSTLGKLFERIVADRLTSFTNQQNLLPHAQFGFRRKHSTVAQLARITDYITHGFNVHKHTGMVLLDLEKAYDTVWIQGLLYLPTYLLYILSAFLVNRSFTVHLKETSSTAKFPPPRRTSPRSSFIHTSLHIVCVWHTPPPKNTPSAVCRRHRQLSPILENRY